MILISWWSQYWIDQYDLNQILVTVSLSVLDTVAECLWYTDFYRDFNFFSKDGFYSKRIRLIRNETSRRSLLPSFQNFHSSLALQAIFRMPSMPFRIFGIFIFFKNANVAKNIWHFYFFFKCQNCPLILAWHFYFKMPCHNFLDGINRY